MKFSLSMPSLLALILAASSPHSRGWFHALPILSRGLGLDDETVRIGVGLWLGLTLTCHTNVTVDPWSMRMILFVERPQASRLE